MAKSSGNTLSIVAIVLGVIALLFVPPLFGIAGIVCAVIGIRRGERLGKVGLGVAIAGLVIGMVLGYVVLSASGGF